MLRESDPIFQLIYLFIFFFTLVVILVSEGLYIFLVTHGEFLS